MRSSSNEKKRILMGWSSRGSREVDKTPGPHLRAGGLTLLPSALRPGPGFILGLLLACFLFQNAYTSNASATSLTLTIPSSALSINLDPNVNGGFATSSTQTVTVKTGAPWGYNFTLKAKDSNVLKNGSNQLSPITAAIDEATFKSNASYNKKWGYIPSKLNGSANTNYQIPPTTTAATIEKTSAANTTGASYTFKLAAKTDNTLPSGNYTNNFTFTAVANTVSYNISYNLNGGTCTGCTAQKGSTPESSIKLNTATPTKANYQFLGWCKTAPTNNNTESAACSGALAVGASYPLTNSANTITLQAVWKKLTRDYTIAYKSNIGGASGMPTQQAGSVASPFSVTLNSGKPTLTGYEFKGWCSVATSNESCSGTTYQPGASWTVPSNGATLTLYAMWKRQSMQDFSCTLAEGASTTLMDKRDGKTYKVAKLKDGKCWMIENLKLGDSSAITLTSTDSDVTSSFTLPASDLSAFSTSNSNVQNNAAYVDETYGGYYTWYTATAGTGTSLMTTQGQNASGSICPKGWKLPTGGSDSDLSTLVTTYGGDNSTGSSALQATPIPGFTYAGYVSSTNGSLQLQDAFGHWWSSTVHKSNYAYFLYLSKSAAKPEGNWSNYRTDGRSVRCVAR